jgi:hypothetical protein
MRLALLVLVATVAASVSTAQSSGVLVVSPAPHLAFDAGLGDRATPLANSAVGPRERGAWRGAKRGFLIGAGIGAVVIAGALVYDSQNSCEYVCAWMLAAVVAVPLTALTTTAGAVIGATNAAGPPPIRPR